MTDRAVEVSYLPGQGRLLQSLAAHILFVAGVAAGKTEGGARWVLQRILQEPWSVGFIGAQTHAQLTRISLPPLLRLLGEVGLEWRLNKAPPPSWGPSRYPEHKGILSIRVPGAAQPCQIVTGSMENYEAHRGLSIGWYWLDEARDMELEAYDVILSRLRGQAEGTSYGGILTTTPNGFGWIHDRFIVNPAPNVAIVRAATSENPFLPPRYVEGLRALYSERFARQELDGEFLNMTAGQMFYAFRRDAHGVGEVNADPKLPMWYSADFNVSPLCSVYGQGDKRVCRQTGEIYIEGSARTADMAEEFCRRHEKHELKVMTIYGDQSGANRDTRSNTTDYEIMEAVFKAKGWTTNLKRNYKNPDMVESVETVNAALEKARFLIDHRCKRTIADLEQVSWKPGTRIPDKSNAALTHCADALRYHVHMEYPMPSRRVTTSSALT